MLHPDASAIATAAVGSGSLHPTIKTEPGSSKLGERPGEGMFEGLVSVGDQAMFDPLPPEIQRYFEGESNHEDGLD